MVTNRFRQFSGTWAIGLMLGLLATPASAADIYVATNGGGGNATNWTTAYTNIQTALNIAAKDDTIYLAGHTFALTNQLVWAGNTNVSVRGGYAATNDANPPGTPDSQLWPTILTRNTGYNTRILTISNVVTGTLERVTLTGGYQTTSYGGGMYIVGSTSLVISACVISNNTLSIANGLTAGGGIYALNSIVTVSNCLVRDNLLVATDGRMPYGGGIYAENGGLTLVNSTIANNRCTGGTGGRYGGGLYMNGAIGLARNCLVVGNSTVNGYGDGIYTIGSSALILENCTVAYNSGQGINRSAGTVAVTNSIIWGNGDDLTGAVTVAYCDIQTADNLWTNGVNGCLSADPLFERGFYLATNSICVDRGTNDASYWGLTNYTTRADGSNDSGIVDLGYHYQAGLNPTWADIYVATDGLDSATGTNASQPFRTLTNALARARDGTRIHVASGAYTNGSELFPLTAGNLTGVQIMGTNRATTVINSAGSGNRIITLTNCNNMQVSEVTLTGGSLTAANGYGGGIAMLTCGGVVLSGCVISNNAVAVYNIPHYGGGIYALNSSVTVSNCLVRDNRLTSTELRIAYGGGIYAENGVMSVFNSVIVTNRCSSAPQGGRYGGGLCINNAIGLARNCLVSWNSVGTNYGDGISLQAGTLNVENCTVANNAGQGIYRLAGTAGVTNSIVWGNGDDLVGDMAVSYSDIQTADSSWTSGVNGCVSFDPLFVDITTFHLPSKQGYYTNGYFSGGGWAAWDSFATNSPAIDVGDPSAAYTNEPVPNGGRVNLGAYGNTPVASLTDTTTVFTAASVTNLGATLVGHRTARLNGQVTNTGGKVPECGFAYWVVGAESTNNVWAGLQNGVFFANVVGLNPGSNYQFQAFASNSAGVAWSDVKSFSTHPPADGLYVATNGNNTAGTNWTTAYPSLQTALDLMETGDTIYVAGHTFALIAQLNWTGKTNVAIRGGYAATNDLNTPGTPDSQLWPTILTRNTGYNTRILTISNVVTGTLERVTLTGGYQTTSYGGGIYIAGSTGLVLSACVISSNTLSIANGLTAGGGIYALNSIVTVSNCLVRGNLLVATEDRMPYGGGIYAENGGLTLVNSVIATNRCISNRGGRYGGGLYINGATCLLRNCLVAGNTVATGNGDGIYTLGSSALTLENCTVAYNSGQGINRSAGTAVVTNSIVWGNGDDIVGIVTLGWSDIENGDNKGVNGNISVDPAFVSINAANYRLLSVSPCFNAGLNQAWMNGARDLDGERRVFSGRVDLGAYEIWRVKGGMLGVH